MEPLNDSHWLEPPEHMTDEEFDQHIDDLSRDADDWYDEQQDRKAGLL